MIKKILIVSLVLILIIVFILFFEKENQEIPEEKDYLSLISFEGSPSMGNPDAPVIIVNYSSYYCSFCTIFKKEIFPEIKKKYIDTGKVFYVYKDAGNSEDPVFLASHCAGDQGYFWEYYDILQEKGIKEENDLYLFAEELNLDTEKFSECLKTECCSYKIEKAFQEMEDLEVSGIPFFIINNTTVSGLADFNYFEEIIESELKIKQ